MQIMKNLFQRKRMLRSERKYDGIVRRRCLQFEVERATEPLPQRQSPRSVDSAAERRVNDQLHAAGFIKKTFHHELLARGNHAQGLMARQKIVGQLTRCPVRYAGMV